MSFAQTQYRNFSPCLKLEPHVREYGVQHLAGVNVAQPLARHQGSRPRSDRNVFRQWRTVAHAEAGIDADRVMDGRLEQQQLERLSVFESQVVDVDEAAQLRREIEVHSQVRQKNTRIHEIGLPFVFVRAQAGQQTVGRRQVHSGAGQPYSFAIPQAENPPGKFRKIFDGVKSARLPVPWISIPGSIESGTLESNPILVNRKLERGHLRVDRNRAPGQRIETVGAESLVKRVCQIHAADVPIARPAEVGGVNAVCFDLVVEDDHANGRRAHQETVVVVMNSALIVVITHAELRGIALKEKILPVCIGDNHLLISSRPGIEPAVGVLLEQIEVSQVVLPAIRIQIAEKSHAGLFVHEQKAPEIGVEFLNARANGHKIKIRAQVVNLHLAEQFLESDMVIKARGARAYVNVHDAELAHVEIVQADRRSHANPPVHRTERRVAVKQ